MSTPRSFRPLPLVVLCVAMALHAPALAQPGTPPTSVRGTMVVPDGEPLATEAALMLRAHPTPSGTGRSGSLTELREGIFVGSPVPVADDGRFVLPLPLANALPSELIGPARDAVFIAGEVHGCELLASDPLALTTVTGFEFVTAPAIALSTAIGTVVGVATDIPFDMFSGDVRYEDVAFQVWVHADRDVRLTTPSDGCRDDGATLRVDVTLRPGWNQLTWRAGVDPETQQVRHMTLSDGGPEEVFVIGIYEF